MEVAEQILACGRMFRDRLSQQIGNRELSQPEFALLWACRRAPRAGLSQSELAAVLAISAAQVSGLVEKLRCHGLLCGRRTRPDRRRQLWKLTPAGRTRLQTVLADMVDWAAALDERLGTGVPVELGSLLDKLGRMLHDQRKNLATDHPAPQRPQTVRHAVDRRGAA